MFILLYEIYGFARFKRILSCAHTFVNNLLQERNKMNAYLSLLFAHRDNKL